MGEQGFPVDSDGQKLSSGYGSLRSQQLSSELCLHRNTARSCRPGCTDILYSEGQIQFCGAERGGDGDLCGCRIRGLAQDQKGLRAEGGHGAAGIILTGHGIRRAESGQRGIAGHFRLQFYAVKGQGISLCVL